MLSETILLERSGGRLLFQKEANGFLRGAVLVLIVILFFFSFRFQWAQTMPFRVTALFFSIAGFLLLGKKRRVTIDKETAAVHILDSFYFIKKEASFTLKGKELLEIDDVNGNTRLLLRMTDGQLLEIAISRNAADVQNWVHAVSDLIRA